VELQEFCEKRVSSLCAPRQCRKNISVASSTTDAWRSSRPIQNTSADPLSNLLTNAVKFHSPDAGAWAVTVAAPEGRAWHVWRRPDAPRMGTPASGMRRRMRASCSRVHSDRLGPPRAQEGTGAGAWRWWRKLGELHGGSVAPKAGRPGQPLHRDAAQISAPAPALKSVPHGETGSTELPPSLVIEGRSHFGARFS